MQAKTAQYPHIRFGRRVLAYAVAVPACAIVMGFTWALSHLIFRVPLSYLIEDPTKFFIRPVLRVAVLGQFGAIPVALIALFIIHFVLARKRLWNFRVYAAAGATGAIILLPIGALILYDSGLRSEDILAFWIFPDLDNALPGRELSVDGFSWQRYFIGLGEWSAPFVISGVAIAGLFWRILFWIYHSR